MSQLCRYICNMSDNELTLEELSERTGVGSRTLRSWVSEGLLAPPFRPGRGARYPATNADRALAVRVLMSLHGLSLSEIRHRFMMVAEEQIRDWALEAGQTVAPHGTARDYLNRIAACHIEADPAHSSAKISNRKSLRHAPEGSSRERTSGNLSSQSSKPSNDERRLAKLAGIEKLILQLEKTLDNPAPRRSRGDIWTRISVTPDLEISIRGNLDSRERILFEQLGDHFRAILSGRTSND